MVTTAPTSQTITITMPSNETGSGATTSGGIRVQHYYPVGPAQQLPALGWNLGTWGGDVLGEFTTTLNGALLDDANGTGGSGTSITLASTSGLPHQEQVLYKLEVKKYLSQEYQVMTLQELQERFEDQQDPLILVELQ